MHYFIRLNAQLGYLFLGKVWCLNYSCHRPDPKSRKFPTRIYFSELSEVPLQNRQRLCRDYTFFFSFGPRLFEIARFYVIGCRCTKKILLILQRICHMLSFTKLEPQLELNWNWKICILRFLLQPSILQSFTIKHDYCFLEQ